MLKLLCRQRDCDFSVVRKFELRISFAHQQAAQAQKYELRLAANDVPKKACGFVTVDLAERCADAGVQEVNQLRIILLLKMVQRAADEPMGAQFAAECAQFGAAARVQNGLRDT
jgi:hypothetical protein